MPFREWRHCAAGVFCGVVPGSCVLGSPEALATFSRRVHGPQCTDDGSALRPARIYPTEPLAEDSLSSAGAAAVRMHEVMRVGGWYAGYYNRLLGGDGRRPHHQCHIRSRSSVLREKKER